MPPECVQKMCDALDCDVNAIALESDIDMRLKLQEVVELARLEEEFGEGTLADCIAAVRAAAPYFLIKPRDEMLAEASAEEHSALREALKGVLGDDDDDDDTD